MISGTEWRIELGDWRSHAEQSAAARLLLCRLMDEEVVVEHNSKGAPFMPSHPGLWLSISHCRQAVAVAVSDRERVGIDVESRRRVDGSLMRRVCSAAELAAVQASPDAVMAFLQLWTRKEAALKLRGTGIRGFGSMVHALEGEDMAVEDLPCGGSEVVASLARAKASTDEGRL